MGTQNYYFKTHHKNKDANKEWSNIFPWSLYATCLHNKWFDVPFFLSAGDAASDTDKCRSDKKKKLTISYLLAGSKWFNQPRRYPRATSDLIVPYIFLQPFSSACSSDFLCYL
jgi:hypothetical protein